MKVNTKKTIDEFSSKIKELGVPVNFELKDKIVDLPLNFSIKSHSSAFLDYNILIKNYEDALNFLQEFHFEAVPDNYQKTFCMIDDGGGHTIAHDLAEQMYIFSDLDILNLEESDGTKLIKYYKPHLSPDKWNIFMDKFNQYNKKRKLDNLIENEDIIFVANGTGMLSNSNDSVAIIALINNKEYSEDDPIVAWVECLESGGSDGWYSVVESFKQGEELENVLAMLPDILKNEEIGEIYKDSLGLMEVKKQMSVG